MGADGRVVVGGVVGGTYVCGRVGVEVLSVAGAREIMIRDAKRTKNDVLLKHLLAEKAKETEEAKEKARPITEELRKRAKEAMEKAAKRRKELQEQARLAANEEEDKKKCTADAIKAAHEAKLAALQQAAANARELERLRKEALVAKKVARWLQTEYPTQLAYRMIDWHGGLDPKVKQDYKQGVLEMYRSNHFSRLPANIPHLWEVDTSFTFQWAQMSPPGGGPCRWVRCSPNFNAVMQARDPQCNDNKIAEATLLRIFQGCIPYAEYLLSGALSCKNLLHMNDYVMEKAFVYGAIALSKWFSEQLLPKGVYGYWPPDPPEAIVQEPPDPREAAVQEPSATGSQPSTGSQPTN